MTSRLAATGRTQLAWYQQRIRYSPGTLGLNYPWMNVDGSETVNYLGASYSTASVQADFAWIAALGVTKIRCWTQLEAVMSWSGSAYSFESTYASNLDDLLTRAQDAGLQVIMVIGDGESSGGYSNLDGKFRWTFVTGGYTAYLTALAAFADRYSAHSNIVMWELQNEPYGNLTFSANAIASGATQAQTYTFLAAAYATVKPVAGSTYVGFSDYEEEQQSEYQLFSSPSFVADFIDGATDVYSMHIYRANSGQVADFRTLTGKPKWCTEIGCYNYYDPTASDHPIAAYDELGNDGPNGITGLCNPPSVRDIAAKLMKAGFSLIMPWSASDNAGLVQHDSTGGYLPGSLPGWMTSQFATRSIASGRSTA